MKKIPEEEKKKRRRKSFTEGKRYVVALRMKRRGRKISAWGKKEKRHRRWTLCPQKMQGQNTEDYLDLENSVYLLSFWLLARVRRGINMECREYHSCLMISHLLLIIIAGVAITTMTPALARARAYSGLTGKYQITVLY